MRIRHTYYVPKLDVASLSEGAPPAALELASYMSTEDLLGDFPLDTDLVDWTRRKPRRKHGSI